MAAIEPFKAKYNIPQDVLIKYHPKGGCKGRESAKGDFRSLNGRPRRKGQVPIRCLVIKNP